MLASEAGTGSCCRPHGSDLVRGLWPCHSDCDQFPVGEAFFFLTQRVSQTCLVGSRSFRGGFTQNMAYFEFLCSIGVFRTVGWDHSCWNAALALCFVWHRNLWWLWDSNGAALAVKSSTTDGSLHPGKHLFVVYLMEVIEQLTIRWFGRAIGHHFSFAFVNNGSESFMITTNWEEK